jgi:RsiW-degrading membrane proteinase PrsW (M82 family)
VRFVAGFLIVGVILTLVTFGTSTKEWPASLWLLSILLIIPLYGLGELFFESLWNKVKRWPFFRTLPTPKHANEISFRRLVGALLWLVIALPIIFVVMYLMRTIAN